MSRRERITKELIVEPGTGANIAGRDPAWTGGPKFQDVKFFLHVSKREQKRRFLARLDQPGKQWKCSAADLVERAHWDQYMAAYDEAITATSTPWYVIPADHKPVMQAMVATILVDTIGSLDLSWPEVSKQAQAANAEAWRKLAAEPEDEPGSP